MNANGSTNRIKKTLPKIGVILGRVPIVVSELIGIEVDTNDAKGEKKL